METNNGKKGGLLKGETHENGGIEAVVTDSNAPVELENNEVIITAPAVEDPKEHTYTGTNKDILSEINENAGGVAIMKKGGLIGKKVHPKNVPESIGEAKFHDENGYFVVFSDGSDGYFEEDQLTIHNMNPIHTGVTIKNKLASPDEAEWQITNISSDSVVLKHNTHFVSPKPNEKFTFDKLRQLFRDNKIEISSIKEGDYEKLEMALALLEKDHEIKKFKEGGQIKTPISKISLSEAKEKIKNLSFETTGNYPGYYPQNAFDNIRPNKFNATWSTNNEITLVTSEGIFKIDATEKQYDSLFDDQKMEDGGEIKTHAQYESAVLETVGSRHYLRLNGESWKLTDDQLNDLNKQLEQYSNPLSAAKYLVSIPKDKYEKVGINPSLRQVKITYDNGNVIHTSMAAHLTDNEIRNYYKVGKEFNIGIGGKDIMAKVESVEILKENGGIIEQTELEFGLGGIMKSVASKTKKAYGKTKEAAIKGKKAIDKKVHSTKKKIAIEVIGDTKDKVATSKEKINLKAAENIVEKKYKKGGSVTPEKQVKVAKEWWSSLSINEQKEFKTKYLGKDFPNVSVYTKEGSNIVKMYKDHHAKKMQRGGPVGPFYEVELFWKGLAGDNRKIGKYVVTENGLEKLEDEWGFALSIDVIDESKDTPITFTKLSKKIMVSAKEKGVYKKGGKIKGTNKIRKVLQEFKDRKLKTPQNKTVTNKKQAVAIALSEQRSYDADKLIADQKLRKSKSKTK